MYQLSRNIKIHAESGSGGFLLEIKSLPLYSSFSVDCETDGYQLHVSGFTDGGAGKDTLIYIHDNRFNGLLSSVMFFLSAGDSLSGHNGFKFSTFDKDT